MHPIFTIALTPFDGDLNLILGWVEGIRGSLTTLLVIITGVALWLHWQMARAIGWSTGVAIVLMWAGPAIAAAIVTAHA